MLFAPRKLARTLASAAGLIALFLVTVGGGIYWQRAAQEQRPDRSFERALDALDANDLAGVERELAQLQRHPQWTPQQSFLEGALLLQRGSMGPALEKFKESQNHAQLRGPTLVLAGRALYQLGRKGEAEQLWQAALAIDPRAVEAHRWLATVYHDLGANDLARAHLEQVSALEPRDPRPSRLLGLVCKEGGRFAAAAEFYREARERLASQPRDTTFYRGISGREQQTRELRLPAGFDKEVSMELAFCNVKLRQYSAALESLANCPPSVERWLLEAESHYSEGRRAEATEKLELALERSPSNLAGLVMKGGWALEAGDVDAAVRHFSAAVDEHPHDFPAHLKLAQACQRAGDLPRAEEHRRIAGEIEALRKRFSELQRLAARQPADTAIRNELGLIASKLDERDLARGWFQAALAIDPSHAEAARNLRGLYGGR